MMGERFGRLGGPLGDIFLLAVWVFVVSAAIGAVLTALTLFVSLVGRDTQLWDILGGITIVVLMLMVVSVAFVVVVYGVALFLTLCIDRLQSRRNRIEGQRLDAMRQELLSLPDLPTEMRELLESVEQISLSDRQWWRVWENLQTWKGR